MSSAQKKKEAKEQPLAAEIERASFRVASTAHHKRNAKGIAKWHKHEEIELLYLLIKEPANVRISKQDIGISAYDVIAYPAGVYHWEKINWDLEQEYYGFKLKTDFVLPQTLRVSDRQGKLLWLFSNINQEYYSPDKNEALLEYYVKALLLNLTKMGTKKLSAEERIEQYIRANFRKSITVGDIVRAAHVSESYACRIAKKRWGVSLVQLVARVRLEEAKRLLLASDHSIEEIARRCGFSSQKYFSRVFHKQLGQTPSQFRQGK